LDFAKTSEAVREHDCGERYRHAGHAPESEVGFFEEVFEVHAVEGGDEGARAEAEGEDGEAQFEEHERVAVGIEDSADAGKKIGQHLDASGLLESLEGRTFLRCF